MTAQEFMKLKEAGKISCEGKMKQSIENVEGKAAIVDVRDPDAVIVCRPVFSPDTGEQIGEKSIEFSISGAKKDLENIAAALAAQEQMIKELEAV